MFRDQKIKIAASRSDSGSGGRAPDEDSAGVVLAKIRKMIWPKLPVVMLERVNQKVLVRITENQSSTTGRPQTELGKQADHSTAYVVLVYGVTNPFYSVSTTIEEKRARLYHFVERLSILAQTRADNGPLTMLITKIDHALTEYNDSRRLKRSGKILNEVLSETGIGLDDKLNSLQFIRIKGILLEKIKTRADIKTVVSEIILLFCQDDASRTDGKEKELLEKLQALMDDRIFSFADLVHGITEEGDDFIDEAVHLVCDVVDEVGLSYVQSFENSMEASQRERILKIKNLCQSVSAATLDYYNHLPGIAFIQCDKEQRIIHGGMKKLSEKHAIQYMNQRYLGKNRYDTGEETLVVENLKQEISNIKAAIVTLQETYTTEKMMRKKFKKSISTSTTKGSSSDLSVGATASASGQQPSRKNVRMTGEFKKVRDQLRSQLEVLEANLPTAVAQDIYGLLDYRKVVGLMPAQGAVAGGGGGAIVKPIDEEAAATAGGGGGAKADSKMGVRTNDKKTLCQVLARHLYLILSVYPQAGLQYGYDINYPDENIVVFRKAVLEPFFHWVCQDWGITKKLDIDATMEAVLNQLNALLKMDCAAGLKEIMRSARSSGNTTEASDSGASGVDSDTDTAVSHRRESDDEGEEASSIPGARP
jgi:hypothetical protein